MEWLTVVVLVFVNFVYPFSENIFINIGGSAYAEILRGRGNRIFNSPLTNFSFLKTGAV